MNHRLVTLLAAAAAAAISAFVVTVVINGEVSAAAATALSTLVLTGITAWYAVETTRSRRQADARWREELEDRRIERAARAERDRLDQSIAAARRLLTWLADLGFSGGVPRVSGDDELAAFRELGRSIEREQFEICDPEVAERIVVCRLVTFTMGFPESEFSTDGRDGKGFAQLLTRVVVVQTRATLEAHVAGRQLPPWPELPRRQYAQAWLLQSGRSGKNEWSRYQGCD